MLISPLIEWAIAHDVLRDGKYVETVANERQTTCSTVERTVAKYRKKWGLKAGELLPADRGAKCKTA